MTEKSAEDEKRIDPNVVAKLLILVPCFTQRSYIHSWSDHQQLQPARKVMRLQRHNHSWPADRIVTTRRIFSERTLFIDPTLSSNNDRNDPHNVGWSTILRYNATKRSNSAGIANSYPRLLKYSYVCFAAFCTSEILPPLEYQCDLLASEEARAFDVYLGKNDSGDVRFGCMLIWVSQ